MQDIFSYASWLYSFVCKNTPGSCNQVVCTLAIYALSHDSVIWIEHPLDFLVAFLSDELVN